MRFEFKQNNLTWLQASFFAGFFDFVQSPSMEGVNNSLDKALRSLVWSHNWPCFEQEIQLKPWGTSWIILWVKIFAFKNSVHLEGNRI